MAKSRKFLTAGAIGVAALALIGTGATAAFQDQVTAQQQITTGYMNMMIDSTVSGATTTGKTLTLPAFGPTGSTFTTPAQNVSVTNNGNIDAKLVKLVVTAPNNNGYLYDGLQVKIGVPGSPALYNGPLTGLQAFADGGIGFPIAHGATWTGDVTFYANNLPNGAQSGLVTPTLTIKFEG